MLWLRQSQTALFQIFEANTSNLNTQKLDVARVEFCPPRRKAEQKADVGLKSSLSMSIPSPQRLIIALPLWSGYPAIRTNSLVPASDLLIPLSIVYKTGNAGALESLANFCTPDIGSQLARFLNPIQRTSSPRKPR